MIGCENTASEPQMLENIRIWAETGTVMTETDGTSGILYAGIDGENILRSKERLL
jgi:hypothetical protein